MERLLTLCCESRLNRALVIMGGTVLEPKHSIWHILRIGEPSDTSLPCEFVPSRSNCAIGECDQCERTNADGAVKSAVAIARGA